MKSDTIKIMPQVLDKWLDSAIKAFAFNAPYSQKQYCVGYKNGELRAKWEGGEISVNNLNLECVMLVANEVGVHSYVSNIKIQFTFRPLLSTQLYTKVEELIRLIAKRAQMAEDEYREANRF